MGDEAQKEERLAAFAGYQVDEALMARTTGEWIARFAGSVPASPVYDVAQALENPFVAEREDVVEFAYPDGRKARMVAAPIRVGGATLPARAAPAMGADTDALLREAGYTDQRIAELRATNVIAEAP